MSSEIDLEVLRKAESADSQKAIADDLGLSVGKVNYILKALIKKGLIKMENFTVAPNKRKYRYILTPIGLKEKIILTERFIIRKKREYEELQRELRELKKQEIEQDSTQIEGKDNAKKN
ncbi:MAG TPA: MarR family EPS-associated transcriptional regulator [Candidatus Marinimicrobia bacterium]|nr:MarR family EPS-associated transcriptional regulator [Candidatus Neomarinimicrobiota bacterium]